MTLQPWLRQATVLSASLGGLAALGAHPVTVAHGLRHPHAWVARAGADEAAAQLAQLLVWCLLAALLAGLVLASALAAAANLPGSAGAAAGHLTRLVLPAIVRRVLGVGVVGVGVSATLAFAVAPAAHATAPGTGQDASGRAAAGAVRVLPAPALPGHQAAELAAVPSVPVVADARRYVVRPGDSLWQVAQRCHPTATAGALSALWPAWYAANRELVGPDPDVLRPGQTLQVPESGCAGTEQ